MTVALPVKGPNLISAKGCLNPSNVRASSCVIGGRLCVREGEKEEEREEGREGEGEGRLERERART